MEKLGKLKRERAVVREGAEEEKVRGGASSCFAREVLPAEKAEGKEVACDDC